MTATTPLALELRTYWGELHLDTEHHLQGQPVEPARDSSWDWSLFGVRLARLQGAWRGLASAVLPFLSEVSPHAPRGLDLCCDSPEEAPRFRWEGTALLAELPSGWQATQRRADGERVIVRDETQLAHGDTLELRRGPARLSARVVHAPRGLVDRPSDHTDVAWVAALSLAGFTAGISAALLWLAPPPVAAYATADLEQFTEHVITLSMPPEPEPTPVAETAPDPAAASGEAAPQEEGMAGRRDAPDDGGRAAQARHDREVVDNAGIFSGLDGGLSMLGEAGISGDLAANIGGLNLPGRAGRGNNGLGLRGNGPGGGGQAEGLGGWGPRGPGGGGNPFGDGDGNCNDCPGKQSGGIATYEEPVILGPVIDRALIQEVVQRSMAQIRYCYQRQLQREPGLGGKVVVRFTIAADGSVSSASTKESTLANETVESCINGRFLRMEFPAIGGTAIVSYPFLFSPG